ncbi:hypothetical protein [Selenomonas bovis]|uniref:hypothetical protein n=1 Tax=Selenomonas bovis TaxID=416586 RepID=UPI000362A611|nr:hypothetical protein [Selenomonas bovis]
MNAIKKQDIAISIAASALKAAFSKNAMPMLSIAELQRLIASETKERIISFYLRSQREAINRILVHAYLLSCSKMESDFLIGHYRDGKSIHCLAMRMPLQERQIYDLRQKSLKRLSALLFYRLSEDDVFFPGIALNLLNVLDVRISTFVLRADVPVAPGFLDSLIVARSHCRALLSYQNRFIFSSSDNPFERCIRTRLAHPELTIAELTSLLNEGAVRGESTRKIYQYLQAFSETAVSLL